MEDPWIQTYTGGRFHPLNPRPEEVNIFDIAHALSMICRYTGHCSRFYSVGEHSIRVSLYVTKAFALEALLHDAAEAYLADIAKPVKVCLPELEAHESRIHRAIAIRYGLPMAISPQVKAVDYALLGDERAELLPNSSAEEWFPDGDPGLGVDIIGWPPEYAEGAFLARFDELWKAREGGEAVA